MKTARYAFAGFVAGLLLALLSGQWVWLEMRVNTGLLLPATSMCSALAGGFFRRSPPAAVVFCLEFLVVLTLLAEYGVSVSPLLTLPGSLLREGFFFPTARLQTVNACLAVLLMLGNACLFMGEAAPRPEGRKTESRRQRS